ncbi:YaiI/YqxD family protein [Ferrimonas senticii]|uniref:YaiI/YqxD family protein n=1 Tax=Ferrimonas senticii TaxID=394566 RepID=UPI000424EC7A|nr:YaiI/YqxD family protein [Ferrimonas senticii]
MSIWVDADACPAVIREILCKAADRTKITTTFVANHPIRLPPSPYSQFRQISAGFDVADNWIVQQVVAGDLVITADIPLAAEVIDKQALALSPRGELYTSANVRQRLNMRDFMDTLRSSGIQSGGPAPLGVQDRREFAAQLDRYLARQQRQNSSKN